MGDNPVPDTKKRLHPRSFHRNLYDFEVLVQAHPKLKGYLAKNKFGNRSIDFGQPEAVIALNTALLRNFYGVKYWELPQGYLCPSIPGRADYIHYLADLLSGGNADEIPRGKAVLGLDIGIGSSCIYPIVGHSVYGWRFVGSEIDPTAIENLNRFLGENPALKESIEIRHPKRPEQIFLDVIRSNDRFDFSMCNPPFYGSAKEVMKANQRKNRNLRRVSEKRGTLKSQSVNSKKNFGGQDAELWCPGGEVAFVKRMIEQSVQFSNSCTWFTTLVSRKEHLPEIHTALKRVNPADTRTIDMNQGQKLSRIVAWTFQKNNGV